MNISNFTLEPESLQEVYLTFEPNEFISYYDTLFIFSNDPVNPLMMIELSGEGIENVYGGNIIPAITEVHQNYPNPFNPQTHINYAVSKPSHIRITVYNIKGEKVCILVDEFHEPQNYNTVWHGRDTQNKQVASGVYFYRFEADNIKQTKKMLLIK